MIERADLDRLAQPHRETRVALAMAESVSSRLHLCQLKANAARNPASPAYGGFPYFRSGDHGPVR